MSLRSVRPPRPRPGVKGVDAVPFKAWLMGLAEELGLGDNAEQIATEVGLPPRRVCGVLHDLEATVSIDTVDRAIAYTPVVVEVDGRPIWNVGDLYEVAEEEARMAA